MNFMGGGHRIFKIVEKEETNNSKEQILNYIQKAMKEKAMLDSSGKSFFKANDEKMVEESQDIIRAKMIHKLCSPVDKKPNEHRWVRHVLLEKPFEKRGIPREIFKPSDKLKQRHDSMKPSGKKMTVERSQYRNRHSMISEWIRKVEAKKGPPVTGKVNRIYY